MIEFIDEKTIVIFVSGIGKQHSQSLGYTVS